MGTSFPKSATSSGLKLDGMSGVHIGPGATPFTLIPSFTSALASERVKVTIAPRVAL
jgi:hypothetical protein